MAHHILTTIMSEQSSCMLVLTRRAYPFLLTSPPTPAFFLATQMRTLIHNRAPLLRASRLARRPAHTHALRSLHHTQTRAPALAAAKSKVGIGKRPSRGWPIVAALASSAASALTGVVKAVSFLLHLLLFYYTATTPLCFISQPLTLCLPWIISCWLEYKHWWHAPVAAFRILYTHCFHEHECSCAQLSTLPPHPSFVSHTDVGANSLSASTAYVSASLLAAPGASGHSVGNQVAHGMRTAQPQAPSAAAIAMQQLLLSSIVWSPLLGGAGQGGSPVRTMAGSAAMNDWADTCAPRVAAAVLAPMLLAHHHVPPILLEQGILPASDGTGSRWPVEEVQGALGGSGHDRKGPKSAATVHRASPSLQRLLMVSGLVPPPLAPINCNGPKPARAALAQASVAGGVKALESASKGAGAGEERKTSQATAATLPMHPGTDARQDVLVPAMSHVPDGFVCAPLACMQLKALGLGGQASGCLAEGASAAAVDGTARNAASFDAGGPFEKAKKKTNNSAKQAEVVAEAEAVAAMGGDIPAQLVPGTGGEVKGNVDGQVGLGQAQPNGDCGGEEGAAPAGEGAEPVVSSAQLSEQCDLNQDQSQGTDHIPDDVGGDAALRGEIVEGGIQ